MKGIGITDVNVTFGNQKGEFTIWFGNIERITTEKDSYSDLDFDCRIYTKEPLHDGWTAETVPFRDAPTRDAFYRAISTAKLMWDTRYPDLR